MTISEIKYNPEHEQIKLLSRQIVLGDLLPMATMKKVIDEMKNTAELRENEKPNYSISSSYP